MIPSMILVGQFDSPVTRRVGIVLHHYGIPFTRDTRSIFGDADGIAKITPMIRIPALILEDGEVLIDSNAILDYLDEQVGPARALIPPSGPTRRKILQTTARAHSCFEKSGQLVYERIFHAADHVSLQWEARCQTQLAAGLAELENLFKGPWLCGDTLTHADIMLACAVGYMNLRLKSAFPHGTYPNLEALAARCETLPAFIAARIGVNETMPKV
jgi:glutathione S-transferase